MAAVIETPSGVARTIAGPAAVRVAVPLMALFFAAMSASSRRQLPSELLPIERGLRNLPQRSLDVRLAESHAVPWVLLPMPTAGDLWTTPVCEPPLH